MLRQLLSSIPAIMGNREGGIPSGKTNRSQSAPRKIDAADTISPLYMVKWINHSPRLPTSRRSARRGSTSSYFPCFHSQISSTSIHVLAIPPQNGSSSEELIPLLCLPLSCPYISPLHRAIRVPGFPRRLPLVNRNEHRPRKDCR